MNLTYNPEYKKSADLGVGAPKVGKDKKYLKHSIDNSVRIVKQKE